jgi:hypothetical protein
VMAVGIGLSVRNSKAVIEALLGKKSEFARTPKYKIEGKQKTRGAVKKAYKRGAGWSPFIELALGIYFIGTVAYAIQNQNFFTLPFLLLFVWGYLYTGLMSLSETYLDRLRSQPATPPETQPAAAGASAPGF